MNSLIITNLQKNVGQNGGKKRLDLNVEAGNYL